MMKAGVDKSKFNNILITGGAGFIGSNLAREAAKLVGTVRVLDNFSTGREENLEELSTKVQLIIGSINDITVARKALDGVETVFHLAALPSVQRSIRDPLSTSIVNIEGTLIMLRLSIEAGVKNFIFSSSSSVYGKGQELPMQETAKSNPASPYALSKLAGEHYCRIFSELYPINTVSLRYFNVFGPRQDPEAEYAAVVPKFISMMLQGEIPAIYGDGKQSRDFTYVDNVVKANLLAAKKAQEFSGKSINVACGESVSVTELYTVLSKLLKFKNKPMYGVPRPGEIIDSQADISMLRSLGMRDLVHFHEGIKKTVEWFKEDF